MAVLGPVQVKAVSLYDRLVAEGALIPAKGDLVEWLKDNPPLPAAPDDEGPTATEVLIQMREDERY